MQLQDNDESMDVGMPLYNQDHIDSINSASMDEADDPSADAGTPPKCGPISRLRRPSNESECESKDPPESFTYEYGTIQKDYAIIRVCSASVGCYRSVMDVCSLRDKLSLKLEETELRGFLPRDECGNVPSDFRFRISIAGCPDSCSQPQISDFGIISRAMPEYIVDNCTKCGKCIATCREKSIQLIDDEPFIDYITCVGCGECTRVCPTKAIQSNRKGYSIRIGGGIGRHPQLGHEVAHLASSKEVIVILGACINLYIEKGAPNETFKDTVSRLGAEAFIERLAADLREYRQRFNPNKRKTYRAF